MSEKCPDCGGYLYRGWHTNVPGDHISREADHAICVMTGPLRTENAALRDQLAQAKAAGRTERQGVINIILEDLGNKQVCLTDERLTRKALLGDEYIPLDERLAAAEQARRPEEEGESHG